MRGNHTSMAAAETMLNAAQAEHGARVRAFIGAQISAAQGWIGFERFMELALYAPGLGYYSAGNAKFGAGGDFTTAPEMSELFGACIARQCRQILEPLGGAGSILEIGAGSGRLAADILKRLDSLDCLPARYWILETSGELRERQGALLGRELPRLLGRVAWLDAPPAHGFDGVILGNEVLDALPAARFRWQSAGIEELGVALRGDDFCWAPRPAAAAMALACERLHAAGGRWEEGYVSEYCPRLPAWIRAVTQALRTGAVLWLDYGLPRAQYYLPERHEGTLLCHFRHRAHADPLRLVGLQDITAWVDFTALAEAADHCGFEVSGFATQALFLAALGIDEEMLRLAAADEGQFARLAAQARRLVLPGEMGERFKAMAWQRGTLAPLAGFELQDLRHTL